MSLSRSPLSPQFDTAIQLLFDLVNKTAATCQLSTLNSQAYHLPFPTGRCRVKKFSVAQSTLRRIYAEGKK